MVYDFTNETDVPFRLYNYMLALCFQVDPFQHELGPEKPICQQPDPRGAVST